jgi:hypothetical protein
MPRVKVGTDSGNDVEGHYEDYAEGPWPLRKCESHLAWHRKLEAVQDVHRIADRRHVHNEVTARVGAGPNSPDSPTPLRPSASSRKGRAPLGPGTVGGRPVACVGRKAPQVITAAPDEHYLLTS